MYEIRAIRKGGPSFDRLLATAKHNMTDIRTLDDPYPTTLEEVRAELAYWASHLTDGEPGSPYRTNVQARIDRLHRLEDRYQETKHDHVVRRFKNSWIDVAMTRPTDSANQIGLEPRTLVDTSRAAHHSSHRRRSHEVVRHVP